MAIHTYEPIMTVEPKDAAYFRALPPQAVAHCLVDIEEDKKHNAIWDMKISPDGRVFFSVCAELAESRYVRLYEYLPETNTMKRHFRFEDKVIVRDREIRASKFHTCMSFLRDGRIIMTTHTTAQAPQHPTWMVEGYYHHVWEGFPGSNLLIYDPNTGVLENRGIPVPHETIYGGTYDPRHNVYYFGGMIRGHAYAYDVDTNKVSDLGQVSEFGDYRWSVGPDGHVYSSSRTGRLFRINTDTRQVEETGLTFPISSFRSSINRNQLNGAAVGPDGRFYMQVVWGDSLFAYDCAENRLDSLGSYLPETIEWPHAHWMVGLHFDTQNVLWYGIFFFNAIGESAGCRLCSWDILRGGRPVDHGYLASNLRGVHTLSEMEGRADCLYICDGNHLFDCCGMLRVDLAKLREAEAAGAECPACHDVAPYLSVKNGRECYPYEDFEELGERYLSYLDRVSGHWKFYDENSESMRAAEYKVVCIWKEIGFDLPIRHLAYAADGTLHGWCGVEDALIPFAVRDGVFAGKLDPTMPPQQEPYPLSADVQLPGVPGRQYLAKPAAWVTMADGSVLVGTQDGMLARVKDGKVFSLGGACFNGPIHQMAVTPDGTRVFGVAGHEMDMGMIFSYDHENGLNWRGRNYVYTADAPYMSLSSQPICCALSPDGVWLAVGVADRMSCVYLYRIGE